MTVVLPLGDLTAAQLRSVADVADAYGNGTIRTTNDQNLVVPFVAGGDLGIVHDALQAIGLAEGQALHLSDVTSCPGADYCSLAVTRSMHVAERIRASLRDKSAEVEDLGKLRIKISGCPNSCGQHHVGDIGLTGMMVKDATGSDRPHCAILVGGSVGEADPGIARRLRGKFPEEAVPAVIAALTDHYRTRRREGESFRQFVGRVGAEDLQRVADLEMQRGTESVSLPAA